MKLQVKFDYIHNLEKLSEKPSRRYKEEPEAFIEELIEGLKQGFKDDLNYDDYCWIENLDVKVVEK